MVKQKLREPLTLREVCILFNLLLLFSCLRSSRLHKRVKSSLSRQPPQCPRLHGEGTTTANAFKNASCVSGPTFAILFLPSLTARIRGVLPRSSAASMSAPLLSRYYKKPTSTDLRTGETHFHHSRTFTQHRIVECSHSVTGNRFDVCSFIQKSLFTSGCLLRSLVILTRHTFTSFTFPRSTAP